MFSREEMADRKKIPTDLKEIAILNVSEERLMGFETCGLAYGVAISAKITNWKLESSREYGAPVCDSIDTKFGNSQSGETQRTHFTAKSDMRSHLQRNRNSNLGKLQSAFVGIMPCSCTDPSRNCQILTQVPTFWVLL